VDKKTNSAIGVFDSGIGGLTVVRALMERLPFENIIYFGDTARVPYGIKSVETINHYASQITEFLIKKDVKLLIVACNTMAAVAYQTIKDLSSVPVLEVIDASARIAAKDTRTKSIGVIGTPATINSNAYARAIHLLDAEAKIFSQACPLFVPLVEEGWTDNKVVEMTVKAYLGSLKQSGIDTLILGCTHYPLLKKAIRKYLGSGVRLVDSAEETVKEVVVALKKNRLAKKSGKGIHSFFVSDAPDRFIKVGRRFLGEKVESAVRIER